eukprot:TRINITY_DN115884_c0_g1_i1.p1 TRINITY_DN115884_c0_g1~~TRINITY_DN115884_c0_g1_i1.p1  ORF type:complete len:221 (+),score=59.21 TRINITY_DN115884_c0_g1_i1:70-732(+)
MAHAEVTVSELFQEYEADFKRLCCEIDERLDLTKEQAEDGPFREAERKVSKAEQAIKQMEMEARSMPPESRSKLQSMIRDCRTGLGERRKAVEAAKEAAARRALHLDGPAALGKSALERDRAEDVSASLTKASRQLAEANQRALESEQISIEVMSDLRHQRETIIKSRDNVGKIGQNYSVAGQMLDSMTRRAASNKRMVYIVCALMLIMLVIAVYFMSHG